jgi:N-acetylglucosamine kinase-like BadF-type ATPase
MATAIDTAVRMIASETGENPAKVERRLVKALSQGNSAALEIMKQTREYLACNLKNGIADIYGGAL